MGGGDTEMLYASLWQVNLEKYGLHEASVIAAKLFEKGVYPPAGVEIIGQWVTTQGRGITIFKCEDPLAVLTEGNVFELEKPGYWKNVWIRSGSNPDARTPFSQTSPIPTA
jgi:hypothetical protein